MLNLLDPMSQPLMCGMLQLWVLSLGLTQIQYLSINIVTWTYVNWAAVFNISYLSTHMEPV